MPLLWLSGAFIVGLVVGGGTSPWIAAAFAGATAAVGALLVAHRPLRSVLLGVAALALGASRANHPPGAPSMHDLAYYGGHPASLQGSVSQEPDIRDTGANYVVSVQAILLHNVWKSVAGSLQVHTARSVQLEYGERVQVTGLLRNPSNSGAYPFRDILRSRGIDTVMSFPRILDRGLGISGPATWIATLRQHIEDGINRALPEPEAALLIAITLGAHSASVGTLAPILVATGLIHLIAISGIKVALVAGMVWTLVSSVRNRLLTLLFSELALVVYVMLTGATASGERSALMWSLVFLAAYLGRNTVALVSLSFVAAAMLALAPRLIYDVGFQLSTVGTLSIVALTGSFLRFLRYLPSPFRESLAVTVAAQVGTLPIVAGGFHSLSLSGPLANGLVLPLVPLAITLGFTLGLVQAWGVVSAVLSALAYAVCHLVVQISLALASSGAALSVSSPSVSTSAMYYLVLGAAMFWLLRRASWTPIGHWSSRGRELSLGLLVAMSAATVTRAGPFPGDRLVYVGSGSAFILQSAGHTALIGGAPHPLAFLSALGSLLPGSARTIDLVVATDPRSAQVAGLTALLAHYRVAEVLDVGAEYPTTSYADWRTALIGDHVPVFALRAGASTRLGDVTISVIAPDGPCASPPRCIGIVALHGPHRSIVLTGAADTREQEESVFRGASLRSDFLVTGRETDVSPDFRNAARARHVWCQGPGAHNTCTSLRELNEVTWPL